jgi:hypothetical protein
MKDPPTSSLVISIGKHKMVKGDDSVGIIGTLVQLGILFALAILCWKGKLWAATSIVLLQYSFFSLVVGLVMIYAIPPDFHQEGPNLPYAPFVISSFMIVAAVASTTWAKKAVPSHTVKSPFFGWVLAASGALSIIIGAVLFFLSVFSPHSMGSNEAAPQLGILLYLSFQTLGCAMLYPSSRMSHPEHPNLIRWLVFFVTYACLNFPLAFSLILIYAVPHEPKTAFPFLSAAALLGYIPFILTLLGITREYTPIDATASTE